MYKCPSCAADNWASAERCEKCGFVFTDKPVQANKQVDKSLDYLESIERSARTIKRILLWWFVLTLLGMVLGVIVLGLR